MKNFFSGFLSVFLLVAFLFTFAFQNSTAAFHSENDIYPILLSGKHVKTIHVPGSPGTASDESPMENEDKDEKEKETEIKIDAALPLVFYTQNLLSFDLANWSFIKICRNHFVADNQHPLYLIIRSFLI